MKNRRIVNNLIILLSLVLPLTSGGLMDCQQLNDLLELAGRRAWPVTS